MLYDETQVKNEICNSHQHYFEKTAASNEHERFPDRKQFSSFLFFISGDFLKMKVAIEFCKTFPECSLSRTVSKKKQ